MPSSLHLSYSINGSFNEVYTSILDFKKFGQLHPYMKSVEVIAQSNNTMEYIVHEKLKLWGIIPMKPCYQATIVEVEKNKHIRYLSEVKKGLFLTVDFIFEIPSNGQAIQIAEHITLQGNPWVHAVFLSLLRKSHEHVFKSLQKNSIML